MDNMKIRIASLKDASAIAEFNRAMALETEDKILDPEVILQGVKSVLKKPELGFYVVAELNNKVVGCLMITTEWSDWHNGIFWWIQSVYIHPEHRHCGIYSKMYEHIKIMATENSKVCGFRLYVDQENEIAQKGYLSLGMKKTNYILFEEILLKE
ncbi:MAG: GNAT family N-acetyltransferase [Candidatus Cloacimonetes bacterium]|nr:GNAT family N-acetyltransferase [Candidatus Cloacimonadota bacterium]MBL7148908.1 GNAT family N-acetyltransferase [Candidatus Cloacimonadota bacterium]